MLLVATRTVALATARVSASAVFEESDTLVAGATCAVVVLGTVVWIMLEAISGCIGVGCCGLVLPVAGGKKVVCETRVEEYETRTAEPSPSRNDRFDNVLLLVLYTVVVVVVVNVVDEFQPSDEVLKPLHRPANAPEDALVCPRASAKKHTKKRALPLRLLLPPNQANAILGTC